MNILFNFINNPYAMHGTDYRVKVLSKICYLLNEFGHTVYVDSYKKSGHPSFKKYRKLFSDFPQYKDSYKRKIKLWMVPYTHSFKGKRYKSFQKRKVAIATYEHGWLSESVFIDKGRLFSHSYFTDHIEKMIEKEDKTTCEEYASSLLKNNLSKRPQNSNDNIPDDILSEYIFVPIQKIEDVSVSNYSKTSMLKFMNYATRFAKSQNIPVVFKQHPHATEDLKASSKHIEALKKVYKHTYCINAPIYDLMLNARFTACVNSGSVVDNFITQTPVYCCGKSFFYKSGTIIFDENIYRGLETMYEQKYDWQAMKDKQLKMLSWLKNNLLFAYLEPKENLKRLERQIEIRLS